jgi:hypothetical protein
MKLRNPNTSFYTPYDQFFITGSEIEFTEEQAKVLLEAAPFLEIVEEKVEKKIEKETTKKK